MTPDRHGTDVGYSIDGCRDECCTKAHRRAQKERTLFRLRNGSCRYTQEELRDVLDPWLSMGVTLHTLAEAVGKCSDRLLTTKLVQRETFAAFAALTEDDLPANSRVPADLTRRRIYSLMAAGHLLNDMPIAAKGHWRKANLIEIGIARNVRAYYRANEFKLGPSDYTATRTKNAGHLPPLSWDDPDTLAWPDGIPAKAIDRGSRYRPKGDYDHAIVERVINGDKLRMTTPERTAVVRQMSAAGWSQKRIEEHTGITKADRYVEAS